MIKREHEMSDEESTQTIDLEELRSTAQSIGVASSEAVPTPLVIMEDEEPPSVTRIEVARIPPLSPDGAYETRNPSWMTKQSPMSAAPMTVQADAVLVEELARRMGSSDDLVDRNIEDLDTATNLPPTQASFTVTANVVTVQAPTVPETKDPEELEELEPEPDEEDISTDAVDHLDHLDHEDETRMGRLDPAEVARAFAQAEASETTAIFRLPLPVAATPPSSPPPPSVVRDDELPRFSLLDDDELPDADTGESPAVTRVVSPPTKPVLELSSTDPDIGALSGEALVVDESEIELLATSGASLAEAAAEAVASPRSSRAAIMAAQRASQVSSSGISSGSVDIMSFVDSEELAPDSADATSVGQAPPMPAPLPLAAPKKVATTPPPAITATPLPPHRVDLDDDEEQLQAEGSFSALLDLYRLRSADADTASAKARFLLKASSVLEIELLEPQTAFETLLTAFDLRPHDDDVAMALDRLGRQLGRITELTDRARKQLPHAEHETRVALLGHLIYWYERCLSRGAEIGPFVADLERLDKTHPVALRKAAQLAAANGDTKGQRELLLRALERTGRRDEKVHLLLGLAGAHGGTPDATKFYEQALAVDPGSIVALQGLERIGRDQEKHALVEWALERQIELSATESERVDALLKLATLNETKFLKREKAAELLERVQKLEPTNPVALKALERCYHALRDWPKLARVIRSRAENTYDKKARLEMLELAAEVLESKLGDFAGAIVVGEDILEADPKNRRALGDLARLSEKLADWPAVARHKSTLAQLTTNKRQASRELVQLGDLLADKDSLLARKEYELAAEVDPTNANAWEALQKVAAAAGDHRRVLECLEERVAHLEAPRQRAAALVELAQMHAQVGNDRKAREAYEAAVADDGTNEAAAVAMLDVYTREEKWDEAAPIAELLVNAAVRDGDHAALFTRLRLQTRIGAAMGDAEKAVTAAIAALVEQPDDTEAQADLVAVCSQCRNAPDVVIKAKDWLVRIADGPLGLPPETLAQLAKLQRDAGDLDTAIATLKRAYAASQTPDIQRDLADTYLLMGDFPRACKLIIDLARNATTADARFDLFLEAGDVWAKKASEQELAASVYEEARRLKPLDRGLLHTLMTLYSELESWDRLVIVLAAIGETQDTAEKKAKSLATIAQIVKDQMGDFNRAADLYDQILDLDPKRLEAFEELVRLLTQMKNWDRLEGAYRKMISRASEDDANLRFALFQQVGLIYRDRLGNAELAYEALDEAARIRPADAGVRRIVTELLVVTDNLDNAVMRIRECIDANPHDVELYGELYELFLRQHQFDKAWCAIDVLAQLQELTPDQHGFHEDYAPARLSDIPGQIVEQAWRSHVFHPDLDSILSRIFAFLTPSVARMRQNNMPPQMRVGRPFTPAHSIMYDVIRETFRNAAEILGVQVPDLLLGDPSGAVPFMPALSPIGAVLVSVPALESRADCLTYVVGKRLAEQRPELVARSFFSSAPELTQLLASAIRVSRGEPPREALDATLANVIAPNERDAIRVTVQKMTSDGSIADVRRWVRSSDLSSMRAALLVAGEVGPARRSILAEPQAASELGPRDKIGELFRFATSDLYTDLRGAIGITVGE